MTGIAGALERHFPVTNPIAREICDQHVERARHRSARLIARGAAMDRDEMTLFILDELAAASEHRPRRRTVKPGRMRHVDSTSLL